MLAPNHVYELVLKGVFEAKISQVTTNPDIPLFKKFRENWKNVDPEKIQSYIEKLSCLNVSEIEIARDDYRELIELSIIFLGGDTEKKFKIRPPGAMHQARCMARAIYSLKISLFSSQFRSSNKDKAALLDVCLFIVTSYVKPWLQCTLAVPGFVLFEGHEGLRNNRQKHLKSSFTEVLPAFMVFVR